MKHVSTIPPDLPFLAELALHIWECAGKNPLNLADIQVFLPTRRACRSLRGEFIDVVGCRAAVLPRMRPLGDLDEVDQYFSNKIDIAGIPPAISVLRRQMLLMQLIKKKDPALPLERAVDLAIALARLLDQVQVERADFSNLKKIVPNNLSQHWQETLEFLEIVTASWPKVLSEEGCIDPAERRNLVLAAQADAWRKNPPRFPVVAAGSTGSIPAVAELLDVISSLPKGKIILPGLDRHMDEDSWQCVGESHPQYNMKMLLEKLGVKRCEVETLGVQSSSNRYRARLLQEALRPERTTVRWGELNSDTVPAEATSGLSRLELEHPQEEAGVISLRMRGILETPGKTAMLVTADRSLASRVSAFLRRWDIEVNDSAGASLSSLPLGGFLNAVIQAARPAASSVAYLTLLKHPLACCGVSEAECRQRARQIEVLVWRGIGRSNGWYGTANWLNGKEDTLSGWCKAIADNFDVITSGWKDQLSLDVWLEKHITLAEKIADSGSADGKAKLWAGSYGEQAAAWFNELKLAARGFSLLSGEDYLHIIQGLIRTAVIRPEYGLNSRLNILGPLEARLQRADVVIIGGLNEGSWPPEADVDPWMSRPMQKDFCLSLPERKLGLSAHDFVQLASRGDVLVTRSKRAGGVPTVASRFLLQLEAVLKVLKYSDEQIDALKPAFPFDKWIRQLDMPRNVEACSPPRPLPPVELRPRELRVTEISTWISNPYAIYARHVLGLSAINEIDEDISFADRGNIIHVVLELFLKNNNYKLPKNALAELLVTGRAVFDKYSEFPKVNAFWWPRFKRIARWFVETMQERESNGISVVAVEASGSVSIAGGNFLLKGRADRIDRLADGLFEIIDYKTGVVPSDKLVMQGLEPQLPLLACMAEHGGFEAVPESRIGGLAYWSLKGGRNIAEEQSINSNINELIVKACDTLEGLVLSYKNPDTPYLAVPRPRYRPKYDDYAHLARIAEWGMSGGDE